MPIVDYFIKIFTVLFFMTPVIEMDPQEHVDWVTFTSDTYGFSVKVPEVYEVESDSSYPFATCNIGAYADGVTYLVSCGDDPFPHADSDRALADQTAEFVKMYAAEEGTSVSFTEIELGECTGVEIEMLEGNPPDQDLQVIARTWIANGHIYTLGAVRMTDDMNRRAIRKFFRSFRLLE